jgi:uncharacterized protein YfaS (alpha-2-macroglobulin family)
MRNILLFISVLYVFSTVYVSTHKKIQQPADATTKTIMEWWSKAESAEKEGKPLTALDFVKKIYELSRSKGLDEQTYKAVCHIFKYTRMRDDHNFHKTILWLEKEAAKMKFPYDAFLYALSGDALITYANENRWEMNNISENEDGLNSDSLSEQSTATLLKRALILYKKALEHRDKLKSLTYNNYPLVFKVGNEWGNERRKNIYSLLSIRILEKIIYNDVSGVKAEWREELSDVWFSSSKTFIHNIRKMDLKDVRQLEELVTFLITDNYDLLLKQKSKTELFDFELYRYDFLKNYSGISSYDTVFVRLLDSIINDNADNKFISEAWYQKALWLKQFAEESYRNTGLRNDIMKQALRICEQNKNGNLKGNVECRLLYNQLTEKEILTMENESAWEPLKPSFIKVNTRNLNKLYFRIYSLNEEDFYIDRLYFENKAKFKMFLEKKPLMAFEKQWKSFNDYLTETVCIDVPAMDLGKYVMVSCSSPDFNPDKDKFEILHHDVTRITIVKRDMDEIKLFKVLDRFNGKIIPEAKITIFERKYDNYGSKYNLVKLKELKTDVNGEFRLKSEEFNRIYNIFISIQNKNDVFYSSQYLYSYFGSEKNKSESSVIFTDRAVYRPGQKVYFKTIVWIKDEFGKPIEPSKQRPISILIRDANYEVIKTIELQTNDFGSASGEFVIPEGKLNGYFTLSNSLTSRSILVEEYKRPTFYVQNDEIKGEYSFGDTVRIPFKVMNYAGYPMNKVKVKYEIKRTIGDYFYHYYRCWMPFINKTKIIQSGELQTNEKGEAFIMFIPLKSENHRLTQYYMYNIDINAIAQNGESHAGGNGFYVSEYPYLLSMLSPKELFSNSDKKIKIFISNLNHTKLPNKKVNIAIYKLKDTEPKRSPLNLMPDLYTTDSINFLKAFPYDNYVTKINQNNKFLNLVHEGTFTSDTSGIIDLPYLPKESGNYIIKATITEKLKNNIKHEFDFTVINPDENIISGNILLKPVVLKNKYEPAEKAEYKIYTSLNNFPFYSDFCAYAQTFNQEILQQNSGWKKLEIKEEHRGGIYWNVFTCFANRFLNVGVSIDVPFSDKKLSYELLTFRKNLEPGSKEKWTIRFKDSKSNLTEVECVSSMYDASLDEFVPNSMYTDFLNINNKRFYCSYLVGLNYTSNQISFLPYKYADIPFISYPTLNDYNYYDNYYYGNYPVRRGKIAGAPAKEKDMAEDLEKKVEAETPSTLDGGYELNASRNGKSQIENENNKANKEKSKIRTNFNETAFFFPHLISNNKGEVILEFTMPEALTKWKWMNLAHTKDFKSVYFEEYIETRKQLMIRPNYPRFLLSEDTMILKAEIVNLSGKKINASTRIEFFDPFTNKNLNALFLIPGQNAEIKLSDLDNSRAVEWKIKVPQKLEIVGLRMLANSDTHSDGEEMTLPIIPNRLVLTESFPFTIRNNQPFAVQFKKPLENKSATLIHKNFTLEYCPEPIWYAIQSMPYLMEYPHECAEQTFSRFYANSVSSFIMKKYPAISKAVQAWDFEKETSTSLLERNPALKQLLIEETPWVLDAKSEKERKRNLKILLDVNRMSSELVKAEEKLKEVQLPNGAFPWFKGGVANPYISAYICEGYGRLKKLNVINEIPKHVKKAIAYLDGYYNSYYLDIKKYDANYKTNNHLNTEIIHFLYVRSLFRDVNANVFNEEFMKYFHSQGMKFWVENNTYMKGMLGLYFLRMNDKNTHKAIMASLKEFAIKHADLGIFWKENYTPYWTEAPIEMQALLIDLFLDSGESNEWVDEMQNWLLKQKQTRAWSNTKSTCAAIYALLLNKKTLPVSTEFEIEWNGSKEKLKNFNDFKTISGTGYYVRNVQVQDASDIKTLANATITKISGGISWGALYWQFEESFASVKKSDVFGLSVARELLVRKEGEKTEKWQSFKPGMPLELGDRIRVKLILKTDRDYEFIHIKDLRPSGCEPVDFYSGYRWQNGLGFYMNIKDASVNFFMDYLKKGTYVLEYEIKLNQNGTFQMAPVQVQCMYAPEFRSFSDGMVIRCYK